MEYILFDVEKIKNYVFDSFKPKEVNGASELIKDLDYDSNTKETGEILKTITEKFPGLKIVYSRGGGGMLKSEDSNGEEICTELENTFSDKVKSAQLTAVAHPLEKDFKSTFAILNYKLRDKKATKTLDMTMEHVVFEEEKSKCRACWKRVFTEREENKNDPDFPRYCDVCWEKRKKGKTAVDSTEDIIQIDRDQNPQLKNVKETTDILVIYGDLNEAGTHLSAIEDEKSLKEFSDNVYETFTDTRLEIERELTKRGFKFLMPVIGGDDMIIFTHPAAFDAIKDKLFEIETRLNEKLEKIRKIPVKMNFAFLTAKHNFPIFHLFNISDQLLKSTKEAYYNDLNKLTYYGFFRLWEGDYMPAGNDVYAKSDFLTLFEMAKEIHKSSNINRSTCHTLLDLIPDDAANAEQQLNLEYFLARHKEFDNYIGYENGKLWLKREKNPILSKDNWKDILDMEGLFHEPAGTNEEEG